MPTWSNLSLQNSSSPLMEQLIFFHDHTMLVLILITVFICYTMLVMIFNKFTNSALMEGQTIEVIWTILPAFILMFIAMPSLRALYLIDEVKSPAMSIKTIGHQWYWSYEYSDFQDLEFDSYMIPSKDTPMNNFRLLEVDNRTVIPYNTQIRMLITATDVLHSWTIPAIGIKVDAIPGRLNQTSFMINHPGLLYGQCSEICGANHSFMPIVLEMISPKDFIKWINTNI